MRNRTNCAAWQVVSMDPMRWWLDWLQSAARGAAEGARGASSAGGAPGAVPNPFAHLFANPSVNPFPNPFANVLSNPFEEWRRWLEALPLLALNPFGFGPFGAGPGAMSGTPFDLAAWWRAMLASGGAAGGTPGAIPADPWAFFRQWYETASAAWSQPLEQMLRSDAFAQTSGALLENASMAQRALRRASEAQLAALGMPSREDVARVAGLVVQVEAKVDGIAEALEDAEDQRAVELTAREDGLAALERRVAGIEARLDRLLALVEGMDERLDERQRRERPAPASAANAAPPSASNGASATVPTRAHKPSTTRSRRKPASAS